MIITVAVVHVMKMAIDEVIDMVAVRHGRMTASRPMDMCGIVLGALMVGRAVRRIRSVDGDRALVYVVAVSLMKMTVVQIVDVSAMRNRLVAAVRAVNVVVVARVSRVRCHSY